MALGIVTSHSRPCGARHEGRSSHQQGYEFVDCTTAAAFITVRGSCAHSLSGLELARITPRGPTSSRRGGKMSRSWSATLSCVGILTVAAGLGIASAQSAAQLTGDHDFVSRVAMSNMAAIQLGHLATKQAQRADVKEFAQATIEDHLKAQKQLADAASGAGIRWPTKLDDKYRQIEQRLSKLSNDKFDREYMQTMIDRDRDVEKMLAATCQRWWRDRHSRCESESMGGRDVAGSPSSPQRGRTSALSDRQRRMRQASCTHEH